MFVEDNAVKKEGKKWSCEVEKNTGAAAIETVL
jgi:hypothetical protein